MKIKKHASFHALISACCDQVNRMWLPQVNKNCILLSKIRKYEWVFEKDNSFPWTTTCMFLCLMSSYKRRKVLYRYPWAKLDDKLTYPVGEYKWAAVIIWRDRTWDIGQPWAGPYFHSSKIEKGKNSGQIAKWKTLGRLRKGKNTGQMEKGPNPLGKVKC